jgi:hypothetical protein
VLAGAVQRRYERFFATEIEPHIEGRTMQSGSGLIEETSTSRAIPSDLAAVRRRPA